MAFAEYYKKQVDLLLSALPIVAKESCFALKGGSAINLFYQDMPRLSVDIDLVYTEINGRELAYERINESLSIIAKALNQSGIHADVRGTKEKKILCTQGDTIIKIEPNYTLRGTVRQPVSLGVTDKVQDMFGFVQMNVLAFEELYAGKFCAALDRQHPRDLFDVNKFYEQESSLSEDLIQCFVVYLLGHNRPVHELLDCEIQDQSKVFENEFVGMTDEPSNYAKLQDSLMRLKADLKKSLVPYLNFISDFLSLQMNFSDFPLLGIQNMPAIQWKIQNLEKLRKTNRVKFEMQTNKLEEIF